MASDTALSEGVQAKLRRLVDRKRTKKMADDAADKATRALREEEEACYEELEELLGDVSTITIDLGEGYGKQQFTRQSQNYHTIYSKEMAFEALDKEALSDEATRADFNGAFLNALVQKRLRQGQPLPDGVGWRERRWITVTQR